MNRFLFLLVVSLLLVSCKPKQGFGLHISDPDTFIVAFGSCNLHDETNHLWVMFWRQGHLLAQM